MPKEQPCLISGTLESCEKCQELFFSYIAQPDGDPQFDERAERWTAALRPSPDFCLQCAGMSISSRPLSLLRPFSPQPTGSTRSLCVPCQGAGSKSPSASMPPGTSLSLSHSLFSQAYCMGPRDNISSLPMHPIDTSFSFSFRSFHSNVVTHVLCARVPSPIADPHPLWIPSTGNAQPTTSVSGPTLATPTTTLLATTILALLSSAHFGSWRKIIGRTFIRSWVLPPPPVNLGSCL